MGNYYVYKYVYHDDIIYIGLTDNIQRRVYEHASGVGLEAKFGPYLRESIIYYHVCANEVEMRALESMLINYYKPMLNVVDVQEGQSTVSVDLDWKLFEELDFSKAENELQAIYIRNIKANNTRIEKYSNEITTLTKKVLDLYPFYRQIQAHFEELCMNPDAYVPILSIYTPKDDTLFIGDKFITPWADNIKNENETNWIQFSGEFLRELFAIGHMPNWINKTLDNVGNTKKKEIEIRMHNLQKRNMELQKKVRTLEGM